MDAAYGGAKPKVKTPRRKTSIHVDEKEDEKVSKSKLQHQSVGNTNNSPSECLDSQAPKFLDFTEDHFGDGPTPKRLQIIKTREFINKGVGNTDKSFVKEFLPLTDELIKNAIKGSVPRNLDGSHGAQHSSSSTDLETVDSGSLPEVIDCKKRKKELSPRDKWKRSGYALRKYLANKFGFRSVSKQTKDAHDSCMNCLPTESVRKHQNRQVEMNPHISQEPNLYDKAQIPQCSDRASHEVIKIKKENSPSFLNKVMKKGKVRNKDSTNCNFSAESSTTTDEYSSISPCSPVQDVDQSDRHLNPNPTNQRARNLNLANRKTRTCSHIWSNKDKPKIGMKNTTKKSCDNMDSKLPLPSKQCINSSSQIEKKRTGNGSKLPQTRKKMLIGVLDAQIGTSSESENDVTKAKDNIKRRKRRSSFKDTGDPKFKLYETDHAGLTRSQAVAGKPKMKVKNTEHSATNQIVTTEKFDKPKDVLHGLKYALPYLPERLKNRLHSSHSDDNIETRIGKKNMKSETSIQNGISKVDNNLDLNSIQKGLRSNEFDISIDQTRTSQSAVDTYGEYINSLKANQCLEKDRFIKVSEQITKTVSDITNSDIGTVICDSANVIKDVKQLQDKYEEMFDTQKIDDSDIKFHLNESGTWTVTGLEESNDEILKEGNNNLMLPFSRRIGPIRRDSYTDWVEQDLMQLEASLEDPFNLRGDNLILNDSSSKGDNSFTGYDSDGESFELETGAGRLDSNENEIDSKFKMHEGLMDLVNGIDKPFIDKGSAENDKPAKDATLSDYKSSFWDTWRRHRDFLEAYDSDSQNSSQEEKSTPSVSLQPLDLKYKEESQLFLPTNGSEVMNEYDSPSKGGNSQNTFQGALLGLSVLNEDTMSRSSTLDDLHSMGSFYNLQTDSSLDIDSTQSFHDLKPEYSLDADDEFECDCEHCISLRQHNMESGSDLDHQFSEPTSFTPLLEDIGDQDDYLMPDYTRISEGDLGLGIQILSTNESNLSLGLGVMLENVILQLLTDNLIMQMINVQPDLLSDQAPPPATQSIIDAIPTINLSQQDIDQNPVCPVCLCPCGLEETMSQLPCQHIFHPICVQAWLVKSGTCPVCRYRMDS